MDTFIKAKTADYYKRLGFKGKKIGTTVIFNKLFDPIFDEYEIDYLKFDKKLIRSFESFISENSEQVKQLTEDAEEDFELSKKKKKKKKKKNDKEKFKKKKKKKCNKK